MNQIQALSPWRDGGARCAAPEVTAGISIEHTDARWLDYWQLGIGPSGGLLHAPKMVRAHGQVLQSEHVWHRMGPERFANLNLPVSYLTGPLSLAIKNLRRPIDFSRK